MRNIIILILFVSYHGIVMAQPNCDFFKYQGDTLKYEACKTSLRAFSYYQFTRQFQEILDESLEIDSTFAYAYREKSVAYLKSGDFIIWKNLMDKAVKYDLEGNLGYRGWCRYQFFRDYEGAIEDFELLSQYLGSDIGYSANGDYHLNIAKAMCYKAIGKLDTAIKVFEEQLSDPYHSNGNYDYLHYGVALLESGKYEDALEALDKQENYNPLAEVYYYKGKVYEYLGDRNKADWQFTKAKEYYLADRKVSDGYTHPMDKIYLEDINESLEK